MVTKVIKPKPKMEAAFTPPTFPPYVSNPSDPDDSVKEAAYNAAQVAKIFPESAE